MDPTASPLLRRLDRRDRVLPGRPGNPFEAARRARAPRFLGVGLHSSLAVGTTELQAILIGSFATPVAHHAIDVFRVAGTAPDWMRYGEELPLPEWWVAEPDEKEDAALLELETLSSLGADLIVTVDRRLLDARDALRLRSMNLMTPEEASVLVGIWTRTIHDAFIMHAGVNNGLYYWAVARAVTPAAWPGFCAFVRGQQALPVGEEIADLAGSILDHLKMLFRGLDRLVATWQCATTNDTDDEMQHEFVQMVIAAWSVHDNIALLVGRYLAIDLAGRHGPAWELGKAQWMASTTRKGATDRRATAIVDLVTDHLPYIAALRELRNDFAHRARDRMHRVARPGGPDEGRLVVRGRMLEIVQGGLARTQEGAEAWGLGPTEDLGMVTSIDAETGESHKVTEGPQSDLDLVPFAARLVAYVSWLANETFRILDPISDERVLHRDRCRESPSGLWPNAAGAAHAIATSGAAGLVDWAIGGAPGMIPSE